MPRGLAPGGPARKPRGLPSGPACRTYRRMSSPTAPPRPITTPCVKVCAVDGESGLCLGCYRTLAEIAGWGRLDEATRTEICAALPARRGRIRPEKLGLV